MPYTVTIDWISFTLKHDTKEAKNVLTYLNPSGIMELVSPRFGYNRASKTEQGATIYASDSGSRLGVHVVIPGSALLLYRDSGKGAIAILSLVVAAKGKVTRLDLAKDAKDVSFEQVQLSQAVSSGRFTGSAQKGSVVKSSDGGLTTYIGSRQSERFIRVYDKGVESGQFGDWVRLELETKGEVANLIAQALVNSNWDVNDILCSQVKKMCQVDLLSWTKLLTSEANYEAPKIEKRSDTEAWINAQVGQAVLNHLDKNPDSPAVRRLYELLKKRYE